MGDNLSYFQGDDLPVEMVTWENTQIFLKKLNEKTGKTYRLPTEAEWEYAAREGGKKARFGNGKDIADPKEMNFDASENYKQLYSVIGEYREKTTPVNQFKPNALGLHDMNGNVLEWCADRWSNYPSSAQTNPVGPAEGECRVVRGGSWRYSPRSCRAANRDNMLLTSHDNNLGFRLAHSLPYN